MNKSIFRDYEKIDMSNVLGIKTYLTRKICFGSFGKRDLNLIKKYYKTLQIPEYRKYYFKVYFEKYDIK